MTILNLTYGTTKEESKKKFLDSGSVFLQLIKTLNHAHLSHINVLEQKEEELREYEYHVKSQLDSIARFKKRHPNGAKIDVNATFD